MFFLNYLYEDGLIIYGVFNMEDIQQKQIYKILYQNIIEENMVLF